LADLFQTKETRLIHRLKLSAQEKGHHRMQANHVRLLPLVAEKKKVDVET